MPQTPNRFPGQLVEDDGILIRQAAVVPSTNGEVRYVTGSGFRFYEEGVERGLDDGASNQGTPTVIDPGTTYTIPAKRVVLFAMLDNQGVLDMQGVAVFTQW